MLIRHHRPTKLQKRKRKAQFFRERAAHSNLQYTMKCSIRQHSVNHLISCLMSLMLLEFNRSPQHLVKLKHSRSTHLTQKTDYNDCILSTHIFTMSFCNRSSKGQTEEHNGTKLQRNDDTHPTTGSHRERWSELLAKRPASKLGATAVMLLNTVVVKQMTNFGVKLNMHLLNRPYRDPPASETSRSWRLSAHHACVDVPRLVVKHQADGHQWDSSITYTSGHSFLHVNNNTTQHNATLQFKLRKLNVAHMNPFALRQDTRTSERIGEFKETCCSDPKVTRTTRFLHFQVQSCEKFGQCRVLELQVQHLTWQDKRATRSNAALHRNCKLAAPSSPAPQSSLFLWPSKSNPPAAFSLLNKLQSYRFRLDSTLSYRNRLCALVSRSSWMCRSPTSTPTFNYKGDWTFKAYPPCRDLPRES